jgi:hypothetical protein
VPDAPTVSRCDRLGDRRQHGHDLASCHGLPLVQHVVKAWPVDVVVHQDERGAGGDHPAQAEQMSVLDSADPRGHPAHPVAGRRVVRRGQLVQDDQGAGGGLTSDPAAGFPGRRPGDGVPGELQRLHRPTVPDLQGARPSSSTGNGTQP